MTSVQLSKERWELLSLVQQEATSKGMRCYLVGGFIRDLLLGAPIADSDVDILVEGSAGELATGISEIISGKFDRFDRFLTAKVSDFDGFGLCREIDFATARTEVYDAPGALPKVSPSSLSHDLQRRDFTVNSIALPLDVFLKESKEGSLKAHEVLEHLIDPFSGIADLKARLLKTLHEKSFWDDPTRLIRLARYCTRLGFELEEETEHQVVAATKSRVFDSVSVERLWSEFKKSLAETNLHEVVEKLYEFEFFQAHSGFSSLLADLSASHLAAYARRAQPFSHGERIKFFQLVLLEFSKRQEVQLSNGKILAQLGIGKRERKKLDGLRSEVIESDSNAFSAAADEMSSVIELLGKGFQERC